MPVTTPHILYSLPASHFTAVLAATLASLVDTMAEDLASLDSIDTSNVMKTLETRFHDKQIYTKNGSVLIAINPYQDVSQLYDQTRLQRYKASMAIDKEAPHIFAVAGAAHRNMISSGLNQAIVISGESGAGKTESARFVLQLSLIHI